MLEPDQRPSERRVVLLVRFDEGLQGLRRRLSDSLVRLAGAQVLDCERLVERMVDELQHDRAGDVAEWCWTLAHVSDGTTWDPYRPRLAKLALIDAPRRGRRWAGGWTGGWSRRGARTPRGRDAGRYADTTLQAACSERDTSVV